MNLDQVPQTVPLGVTASSAKAAKMLDDILLPGRGFTHWEPIHYAARSGRVLYQKPRMNAALLPRIFKGSDVMMAFASLGNQARYQPSLNPGHRKGWSVGEAVIDGMPAAIVWCEWID